MRAISEIKANIFSYRDVMDTFAISEYETAADVIAEWETAGLIAPVKAHGRTSFKPHIYQDYRKLRQKIDYTEEMSKIHRLHPLLVPALQSHPEHYRQYKAEADALSAYLIRRDGGDKEAQEEMSVKERSYQIWGDEKAYEKGAAGKLCQYAHIALDELNAYRTHELFFVKEVDTHGKSGCALILENKDPWYTLARLFGETGYCTLAGKRIRHLIYGEGRKAAQSSPYEEDTMTGCIKRLPEQPDEVLYAGDIDRAGFAILSSCQKNNPKLSIQPIRELYRAMVDAHMALGRTPNDSPDKRDIDYDECVLDIFCGTQREYVKSVLDREQLIPQEVLNAYRYKKLMTDNHG